MGFRGLAAAVCLTLPAGAAEAKYSAGLWEAARPLYAKIVQHPFLRGLADGTLARAKFDYYLKQDALYLWEFARALSVLAAKAPRQDWMSTLNQHAIDAVQTEMALHKDLLKESAGGAGMAPANRAYTSHLLASVHQRPFFEGLAAMLPCYWVYWEVGKELKKRGSKDPDYQRWIDQYADPSFGAAVNAVLAMIDAEAQRAGPEERARARELFLLSVRYEYMFWDMAWREQEWLP